MQLQFNLCEGTESMRDLSGLHCQHWHPNGQKFDLFSFMQGCCNYFSFLGFSFLTVFPWSKVLCV